jgi:hypothetical protein
MFLHYHGQQDKERSVMTLSRTEKIFLNSFIGVGGQLERKEKKNSV